MRTLVGALIALASLLGAVPARAQGRYVAGYVVVEAETRHRGAGRLSVERLAVAIEEQRSALVACGQAVIDQGTTLTGRLTLELTVHADASVHEVRASANTTGSRELARCVVHVVRGIRVRPGARGGDVTFVVPIEWLSHDVLAGSAPPSSPPAPSTELVTVEREGLTHSGAGDFDDQAVLRMLQVRSGALRACYGQALRASPTLAGRLVVHFTLTEAGMVTDVSVTSAELPGGEALAACVSTIVMHFRFNPGADGGSLSYSVPITFAQGDRTASD